MNVYVTELNKGCYLMLNVDPNLATYTKGGIGYFGGHGAKPA